MLQDIDKCNCEFITFFQVTRRDEMEFSCALIEGRFCRGHAGMIEVRGKSVEGRTNLTFSSVRSTCTLKVLRTDRRCGLIRTLTTMARESHVVLTLSLRPPSKQTPNALYMIFPVSSEYLSSFRNDVIAGRADWKSPAQLSNSSVGGSASMYRKRSM